LITFGLNAGPIRLAADDWSKGFALARMTGIMLSLLGEALPMTPFFALLALALTEPTAAHDHHQHDEKLGSVIFETTCSPAAGSTFTKGLTWLHSFEYEQAEKAFNQAATDPMCSIAYWGVAMSLYHPLWAPPTQAELERGRAAVAKALARPAGSEREQGFIAAIAKFYHNSETEGHGPRVQAYTAAMGALHERFPADNEVSVFYALSKIAAGALDNDPEFAREKNAAAVLNRVLQAQPNHPGVTHYLIHSFDYPALAQLAVPAARSYADIAPASPHAQHMPSHIFTRLGMWSDSIASNLKSAQSARDMMARKNFDGASREELHALDYLAYGYLQTGQDTAARGVLDHLNAMTKVDEPIFSVAFAATAIPARLALERKDWAQAAKLELPANVASLAPLSTFRWGEAHVHFARAVGAARSGDVQSARVEVGKLTEIEQGLTIPAGTYDWKTQVQIQRGIAEAWLAFAEGNGSAALPLIKAAADLDDATEKHPVTPGAILPAREQLGELLLALNQPAEALTEFEASLKRAPARLAGLYGAAEAARQAAQPKKAQDYFGQLRDLTKDGDDTRLEIKAARLALLEAKR
jgi:hypothetical protein